MNNREAIADFLREQFETAESEGEVSMIGVLHFNSAGQPEELRNLRPGITGWGDAEKMATTLDNICSRHARAIPGHQQFAITITRGTATQPSARLSVARAGFTSLGSIGAGTEAPTEMGRTQQSMRWGEQIVQLSHQQSIQMTRFLSELLESTRADNQRLSVENRELWLALKQVLLELQEKSHKERMSELTAARMAEFQRNVMHLAPALLNMMSGKEVFPLSAADTAIIDGLAEMASPEDVNALVSLIGQKQNGKELAAIFMDRYKNYHERKARVAAEEKRLLKNAPMRGLEEAEADAMGDAVRALRSAHLGGGGPPPRELTAAVKAIAHADIPTGPVASSEESNGGAPGGATPTRGEDTALVDDLLQAIGPQADMMLGYLGAANPELAERLKARIAQASAGDK